MLRSILSGNADFLQVVVYVISCLTVIFLTLPIHEFAHGWVATKLGDDTPRYQGRLSLNPLVHIDYFGALCILMFGFGWAKPVQVNTRNFRNPKRDMAITALAGPLSNLIMAFLFFLLANGVLVLFASFDFIHYIVFFFGFVAKINITLAVFNLIPIPPLDGSRIIAALLPDRTYYKLMQYERYLYFALLALLFLDVLDLPLSLLSNGVISFMKWIFDFIFPQNIVDYVYYIISVF